MGEQVTITSSFSGDCDQDYTFTVDGTPLPTQTANSITRTFTTAGDHTVSVRSTDFCDNSQDGVDSLTFHVAAAPSGTISLSPDPPVAVRPTTVAVSPSGGEPGYTFAWDSDDDGAFDDQTDFTYDTTFATPGPKRVRVRIRDSAPNQHETIVTRTFTVAAPPAPGSPEAQQPPPAPKPCTKRLAFQLSELTTSGCFADGGGGRWTTTSQVKLNGIVFPAFGQTFTVQTPTATEPGGHFTAPSSTIQLGGLKVFAGDLDWTLPAGGQNDEKTVKTISVALGAQLFGLNVKGSVGIRMGWDAKGVRYATFPLNIEFPAGFETGPNKAYARATGAAALRVDDGGIHYDGLQLKATNVWLGKIKVAEACFSFVPAGGQAVQSCPAASLNQKTLIACATDVQTDRWDGSATIEIPSSSQASFSVYGGLANGTVSKLGGFADNLGGKIPLAPNVYLNRLGLGLCLSPPPFKLRGDVGVAILPTPKGATVGINGRVLYTDGADSTGWTLEVGGDITVFGTEVGSGSVTTRGTGVLDFGLQTSFNAYDIVSLDGSIDGWVDTNRNLFNVEGGVKACVGGSVCAQGSGLVSSVGAAGCVTIVSEVPSPDLLVSFNPFRVRFDTRRTYLTAGFGYRWGASSPDLFVASCDFGPYRQIRTFAAAHAAASGAPLPVKVGDGTTALTLRVRGTTKTPPKVVLRGPGGQTITSPKTARAAQQKGRYLLAENKADGTTSVVLVRPAAGTWTVAAAPGSASRPTKVDVARPQPHPTFGGQVVTTGGGREARVVYAVPKGTSVRLVERAAGVGRTLATPLRGHRCATGPATRPGSDQPILCARVPFTPARGPGGKRTIEAVVTRGGVPIATETVASYTAPKQGLPSRPGALRAHRANGFLVVAFPRSRGASRYAVSASLSDGRELGFDLDATCEEVQIPAVPSDVSARVTVAGVRYDLVTGAKRAITVGPGVQTTGARTKVPRGQWRARRTCR